MITKRAEIAINFFSLFLDQRFEISFARNITLTRKLVVIIFNSNTIDTFLRTVVFHSASYIFTSATTYIYIYIYLCVCYSYSFVHAELKTFVASKRTITSNNRTWQNFHRKRRNVCFLDRKSGEIPGRVPVISTPDEACHLAILPRVFSLSSSSSSFSPRRKRNRRIDTRERGTRMRRSGCGWSS